MEVGGAAPIHALVRHLRTILSVLAIGVATLLPTGLALADSTKVEDANDSRSPLDIKSVTAGHADGRLTYTIETYERFTRRDFEHRIGSFRIWFHLNSDRRPDYELYAITSENDGRIYANLGRAGPGTPTRVRATRPSSRSIRFTFSPRLIRSPSSYRWQAESENRRRRDFTPSELVRHHLG